MAYADGKADGAVSTMDVESSRLAMPRRLMQALAGLVGAPFVMGVDVGRASPVRCVIGDPDMMADRLFLDLVEALGDAVVRGVRVTLSSGSGMRSVRLVGFDEPPRGPRDGSCDPQEDDSVAPPAPPRVGDGAGDARPGSPPPEPPLRDRF